MLNWMLRIVTIHPAADTLRRKFRLKQNRGNIPRERFILYQLVSYRQWIRHESMNTPLNFVFIIRCDSWNQIRRENLCFALSYRMILVSILSHFYFHELSI